MGYRLQVMKKMKNLLTIVMLVVLVALPTKAQTFGGYDSRYSTVPTAAFQSTSAMPMSGSVYASRPALNADGSAYSPSAMPSGPRRMRMDDDEEDDEPGVIENPEGKQPLGDPVPPLMLLAIGYAFFIAWRRKMVKR